MRDELVVPRDRRLTHNRDDDVQHDTLHPALAGPVYQSWMDCIIVTEYPVYKHCSDKISMP